MTVKELLCRGGAEDAQFRFLIEAPRLQLKIGIVGGNHLAFTMMIKFRFLIQAPRLLLKIGNPTPCTTDQAMHDAMRARMQVGPYSNTQPLAMTPERGAPCGVY